MKIDRIVIISDESNPFYKMKGVVKYNDGIHNLVKIIGHEDFGLVDFYTNSITEIEE